MIIELPISNDASQIFTTQLGDTKYDFQVVFNERSGVWMLDISDNTTKTPLLTSLALVLGQELFEPYNLNIGRLLVVDTSNQSLEATFDDMGDRVKVYWFSDDEVLP